MPPDDALQERVRALFVGELDDALRVMSTALLRLEGAAGSADEPEMLRELFRVAHNIKGAAHAANVSSAARIAHDLEDAFGRLREGALSVDGVLVAELLALVDALAATVPGAQEPADATTAEAPPRASRDREGPGATGPTVRVRASKLDELVDRASDLLTLSGQVTTLARDLAEGGEVATGVRTSVAHHAAQTARELTRLTADLANDAVALTFRSFADVCDGLDRVAHDLARKAGKQVRLDVVGGGVEVDRAVAAALREPLLHLVRNAVDHGIEAPAGRQVAGKEETGQITITARLSEGHVEVAVADDGRGVDLAGIRQAAEQMGVDATVDEDLLFTPGLSTTAAVTDVSGRGVGLDAVRARLASIGGTAQLRRSSAAGTVVALTCPVTLALLRALVVVAAGEALCVPLTAITRLRTCPREDLQPLDGALTVDVDGVRMPMAPLAAAAGLSSDTITRSGPQQLLVVDAAGQHVAFVVDRFVDEADVVIKQPPARLAGLDTVLGTTTLLDGRVALVLNVVACVRHALEEGTTSVPEDGLAASPRRCRILVVDDTVTTRALEVGILRAAGYDVVAAGDGAEAWELLGREDIDLVLTDVHMPEMDGVELCQAIRASARHADLPVVMVTSLGTDEERRRGLDAGASAYIVKAEFDQDTLLDVIDRAL